MEISETDDKTVVLGQYYDKLHENFEYNRLKGSIPVMVLSSL